MKGFGIEIKNDLLEPKHVQNMGVALWLFLWLIDHVTSISEEGIGTVLGGAPVKFEKVQAELGMSADTYTRWIDKLLEYPYIEITRTPYGISFKVYKIYKHFNRPTGQIFLNRDSALLSRDSAKKRRDSAEVRNVIKTDIKDNNNKTYTFENLKAHKLWNQVIEKYPDRDYEFQFNLMIDWWNKNKRKPPTSITAFTNWISKDSTIDRALVEKRLNDNRQAEMEKQRQDLKNTKPINPKTLAALREKMQGIGKKM